LHLRIPLAPLAMRLTDHNRKVVATGYGEIDRRVTPGLYVLQIFAGPRVERRFLSVSPEGYEDTEIHVEIPSAAPIGGTSTVHEFHSYPAMGLSHNPMAHLGYGGRLVLFVRNMGENPQAPVMPDGLELLSPGLEVLANAVDSFQHTPDYGWIGFSADVDPGGYLLRMTRPRRRSSGGELESFDQSLWVEEGWITLVFIPYRAAQGHAEPENASVHMSRLEVGFDPYEEASTSANVALEVALSGLRQGRAVVPRGFHELMLRDKFENPMLGIVGALAELQSAKPNWTLLDTVRRNLRRLVPSHPDLHAIHIMQKQARGDRSETRVPEITWPPILYACYRGVIERDSGEDTDLIAADTMADLAAARLYSQGPWTRWQALMPPEQSPRSEAWDKRLQQSLDEMRQVMDTGNLSGEEVEVLRRAWEGALMSSKKPRRRRRRAPSRSSTPDIRMFKEPQTDTSGRASARETALVANHIQELTEQIAKDQLVAWDEIFDVSRLSGQTGLPRAAVRRALKSLAESGFKI
jgi:hypothetical protein